ncbi:MAG: hypothetical protein AAF664_10645 [Planctomycetota bacterium]
MQRHLLRSVGARRRWLSLAITAASVTIAVESRSETGTLETSGSMIELERMPVQVPTPIPSLPDSNGRRINPFCLPEAAPESGESNDFGILLTSGEASPHLKSIPATVHAVTDPITQPEQDSTEKVEDSNLNPKLDFAEAAPTLDEEKEDSPAITFSLSDADDAVSSSPISVEAMPLSLSPTPEDERISLESVKPLVLDASKSDASTEELTRSNAGVTGNESQEDFVVDLKSSLDEEKDSSVTVSGSDESSQGSLKENKFASDGEPSLLSKRFRPPVAVNTVPMAIAKADSAEDEGETLDDGGSVTLSLDPVVDALTLDPVKDPQVITQPSSTIDEGQSDLVTDEASVDTDGLAELEPPQVDLEAERLAKFQSVLSKLSVFPLEIGHAEVRTLTLGASISNIEWEDDGVCQAFRVSPTAVKLVGLSRGSTRLIVWAEPSSESGPHRPLAFEINVDPPVMQASATGEVETVQQQNNILSDFNESLAKAFPQESLVIHATDDGLAVSGSCDRSKVAKVLRMVRRTFTVPVSNRIITR